MGRRAALVRRIRGRLTSIVGAVPDLKDIRNWKMQYGRFVTDEDLKKMARVCLIGQTVRRKLFPDKPDPLGEVVRVDHINLVVVGDGHWVHRRDRGCPVCLDRAL